MITSKAKKVVVVAVAYCFLAVLVLAATIYYTEQNKKDFAEARNSNAKAQAMQKLSNTVEQTLLLSEDDRRELNSFFISERDTIHLITQVEEMGDKMGTNIETSQLSVVPKKGSTPSRLEIGFVVEGFYNNVASTLFAIETLPYHKRVPQITVLEKSDGLWEGTIVLHVTLQ